MLFVIFIGLGFSCQPLFANGFWNTYNRTFDNVKHVFAETLKTPYLIEVDYSITSEGKKKTGVGQILEAGTNELFVYNEKHGFFKITNKDFISRLNPIRTTKTLIKKEFTFNNITMDSLRRMINKKIIIDLKLQTALPVYYIDDNQPKSSTSVAMKFVVNPSFRSDRIDSVDLSAEKEIQELEIQMQLQNEEMADYIVKRNNAENELKEIQGQILSEDLSTREKGIHMLSQKEAEVKAVQKPFRNNVSLLMLRKKYLIKRLHIHKEQSITGYISYFKIT
jgi:inner membrane protein